MKNAWLAIILGVAAVASAQVVTIPQATPVRVRLMDTVASDSAHVGDAVRMETLDDLTIDGVTVIRRGAKAVGRVTLAEEKKRMGRAGKVSFSLDYILAADGSQIPATAEQHKKGSNAAGTIGTGVAVSAVVFAPAAPLWLLKHGKDTAIPFGTVFTVYTSADALVDAAKIPAPKAPALATDQNRGQPPINEVVLSDPTPANSVVDYGESQSLGDAARAARAKKAAAEPRQQ